ncbi:hypothetical protein TNCV_2695571 [Trichonephila clavipes]|nr:hypothetical protein TNCV_2695571 [Trichonephila clavipes]
MKEAKANKNNPLISVPYNWINPARKKLLKKELDSLLQQECESPYAFPVILLLSCVYCWDTYERREIDEQKHITQPQKNTDFITNDDPSI